MYEQHLHQERNSFTSVYYATRVLQGYLSRNTTHTVLPKLGLAMKQHITAQQNTVGHKRVSNKTAYNSSPKRVEESSQPADCMEVDSHKGIGLR